LIIKGFVIDRIRRIHIAFPSVNLTDFRQEEEGVERVRQIAELYFSLDAAKKDEIWRTMVLNRDSYHMDNIIEPALETLRHRFEVLVGAAQTPPDFEPSLAPESEARWVAYIGPLAYNIDKCLVNRCLCTTADGYIGIGPPATKPADIACVLFGGKFCYVLREEDEDERCILLGDAYVHDIVYCELK
jgi:hypothetical protein